MGAKRQRESQRLLPAGSKKRQKVEIAGHDSTISNCIFNTDELNWQKVQLPDRLDDAGGFFGLEEIEGVEVVRPKGKGQIKFKVCRGAKLLLQATGRVWVNDTIRPPQTSLYSQS